MTGRSRLLTLTLLFAALSTPALTQTEEAPERRLNLEEVRELRKQADENTSFSDVLRAGILERYDAAIGSLEAASAFEAEAKSDDREKAGVGHRRASRRARADRNATASPIA
jgi:hypothetical protein